MPKPDPAAICDVCERRAARFAFVEPDVDSELHALCAYCLVRYARDLEATLPPEE
jgi:hypothetical protein